MKKSKEFYKKYLGSPKQKVVLLISSIFSFPLAFVTSMIYFTVLGKEYSLRNLANAIPIAFAIVLGIIWLFSKNYVKWLNQRIKNSSIKYIFLMCISTIIIVFTAYFAWVHLLSPSLNFPLYKHKIEISTLDTSTGEICILDIINKDGIKIINSRSEFHLTGAWVSKKDNCQLYTSAYTEESQKIYYIGPLNDELTLLFEIDEEGGIINFRVNGVKSKTFNLKSEQVGHTLQKISLNLGAVAFIFITIGTAAIADAFLILLSILFQLVIKKWGKYIFIKKHFRFSKYSAKSRLPIILTFPRSFLIALLSSVFFLAFIITDYWNMPNARLVKFMILTGSIALGIIWAFFAVTETKVNINLKNLSRFTLLLVCTLILNYLPLNSVIPWRGDEDFHIRKTIVLFGKISQIPWYVMTIIFISWGLILYLAWHKPKWAIIAGAFSLCLLLLYYPPDPLFANLRYPYFNYWIYTLVLYPAGLVIGPYHEILYRIIPFLSVIALAWYFQRDLIKKEDFSAFLWGLTVVLIPIVYYYSSILYIEMLSVFLMTIVCLHISNLITKNFIELRHDAGWYALILIGFIKETTLPFLMCFLIYRATVNLCLQFRSCKFNQESIGNADVKRKSSFNQFIRNEFPIFFVTCLPIIYYLSFRMILTHGRTYNLTVSNLLDFSVYTVLIRSLFEQFGIYLLLFLGGCILLIIQKKYSTLLFYLVLILCYSMFFLLDQKGYIGYSRFNLFFLPPILAGSSFLIKTIIEKKRLVSYLLVVLTISISILISPIQLDGTKAPYWGNYFIDTSEHYYPVEEAISWLKETDPGANILYAGIYYPYYFDFYTKKLNWRPSKSDILISENKGYTDMVNLEIALTEAEKKDYNNVLLFVQGKDIPQIPKNSMFYQKRIFRNLSHSLVMFSREN